jgi:imidazoleglycerol-phosphate dehydratase
MFKEFFRAFVNESRITLHITLVYGENDHHKIEAVFKSFARALKEGCEVISNDISSSKGVL